MTREEKISRIKRYRPALYNCLKREVPSLVEDPDNATSNDIRCYNRIIAVESKNDTFKRNFSF